MSRSKRAAREARRAEQEAKRRLEARRRLVRNIGIGTVATAVTVLAFVSLGGSGSELEGDTSADGWDLPGLYDTSERIALADFAGKPTVAVFFASWCEVCERELPGFVALSDQLGDQVAWVGINTQDGGGGKGDAEKWGIDTRWPLAQDVGGTTGSDLSVSTFGMRGMPLTVIYDDAGEIVHVQRGGMSADGLLSVLQQAFGVTT